MSYHSVYGQRARAARAGLYRSFVDPCEHLPVPVPTPTVGWRFRSCVRGYLVSAVRGHDLACQGKSPFLWSCTGPQE